MKKKLLIITMMLLCCFTFILTGCNGSTEPQKYTIDIETNLSSHCDVYGEGSYYENSKCTIAVVLDEGYEFVKWSDDVTTAIREITVSSNQTYTAEIKSITPTYAIDEVELYVEEYGTLTAKCVEFESFYVYIGTALYGDYSNVLTMCDVLGKYIALGSGSAMVEYRDYLSKSEIRASEESPFRFYSRRSDDNVFVSNQSKEVVLQFQAYCHSRYIDDNGNIVYGSSTAADNHSYSKGLKTSIVVNASSLTQEFCVYTDSLHGYKIMAKLNFVEI